jgi:hypothetical protein
VTSIVFRGRLSDSTSKRRGSYDAHHQESKRLGRANLLRHAHFAVIRVAELATHCQP